jgi:hypothetical protein
MEPGELWQSDMDPAQNYTDTKVGNWYLANDLADQVGEHSYVLPWGRLHPCARDDLKLAMKTKEEGEMVLQRSLYSIVMSRLQVFANATVLLSHILSI